LENLATKQDLEKLATHEDVMRVAETLEHIAVTSATKVEDKSEAGYVTLESLFKGLEDRLATTKLELGQYTEKGFQEVGSILQSVYQLAEEQTKALSQMRKDMDQRFSQMSDIMRSWVYKQSLVDNELKKLKEQVEKLSGE
jgi:hypothetical protein